MKKEKRKGYIAPITITVIVLLYFILYFGVFIFGVFIALLPGIWKYALLIIPLVLAGVLIYVCIERIKEIRSGEEDDLSKY